MVVATGLHLEAEAAVFANRRCLGYIVQLDELDGVPQRPTAAVAHRHVARHLNDRHLVDERLGVAPVDPVLDTTGWTAITADNAMKTQIVSDRDINLRDTDKLVVGNWMDVEFCKK